MTELPDQFVEHSKQLFGSESEFQDFISSFSKPSNYGLRLNSIKSNELSSSVFEHLSFLGDQTPWCEKGFYFSKDQSPGKSALHQTGLYYLQEPSAMLPASLLPICEGDKILDICAAPGGKTTQLAAKLNGTGLIVANDINIKRCMPLIKNIELAGIKNCVVSNETPQRLSKAMPGYFDKILIDAPCSGEGMFRRDDTAQRAWANYGPNVCAEIQKEILDACAVMLKSGGLIAYSTCTFNRTENEDQIINFLERHKNFEPQEIDHDSLGVSKGFSGAEFAARIFPHRQRGEGHFTAVLRKTNGENHNQRSYFPNKLGSIEHFAAFCKMLNKDFFLDSQLELRKEALYCLPQGLPDLSGLKILRIGLYLGDLKKNAFEPSFALAHALKKEEFSNILDLDLNNILVTKYLSGESFDANALDGYCLVCCEGLPLGFAKAKNSWLKNKRNA